MPCNLSGKIALITGASRGIGAAVAKTFAENGARVILVARSIKGLEETDDYIKSIGGRATLVPLDLKDFNKLEELRNIILQQFGLLDIVVGNAAILGMLGPITHFNQKTWQDVITINQTANWQLLKSMDPLLKRSKAGRAIFVTSNVASYIMPYFGAYAVAKAGLEMLVKLYAEENKNISNVKANLIDPRLVNTDLTAEIMPGKDLSTLPQPQEVANKFMELASENCNFTGQIVRV